MEKSSERLIPSGTKWVSRERFELIEHRNHVRIPSSIQEYYLRLVEDTEDVLIRRMVQALENEGKIIVFYEFTEAFAIEIIEACTKGGRDTLETIKLLDLQGFIAQYEDELSYLLVEGTSFYNPAADSFEHSVLDSIYKNRAEEYVIKTWVLGMDCGGFEGIILNTEEEGCFSLGSYGQFQTVEIDGKNYKYYKYERLLHQNVLYLDWLKLNKK